uniref:ABC transmembrane type-2 domain-containing protein n=1 Tax=Tolypiocladia glomerulata TaxID=860646 RepID=A0A1Z1MV75_9FLOR|nr:hypothetical protein [Tolypiocladia glomerulata]ARW69809.1 hypothetical protein [Tolypiocladia glomerulata]
MKKEKNTIYKFTPQQRIKFHYQQTKTYQEAKKIIERLYKQTSRRPSIILINVIQPLLWLIMFGALFQNAPIYLFEDYNLKYRTFLNPGILIFTAFSSSINAGLNIIFDREFGFLNKILVSPISNKNSLVYSCIIHTWSITMIQIVGIIILTESQSNTQTIDINYTIYLICSLVIASMIIVSISNISICNAFILPGHIEFIGLTTLFLNLPTLFTSTALAPLSFMPHWLQIICCMNPLTYAIEIIRNISSNKPSIIDKTIINTGWLTINITNSVILLFSISLLSLIIAKRIIKYKYDKT